MSEAVISVHVSTIQVGPVPPQIVLAPPTKRKHPAPPPALQQTSPAQCPINERLLLLLNEAKGRNLSKQSPENVLLVYTHQS